MSKPYELTIVEARQRLKAKQISALELMQSILQRIDEVEEKVKAYLTIVSRKELLRIAKEIDQKTNWNDKNLPLLTGIPVAVNIMDPKI